MKTDKEKTEESFVYIKELPGTIKYKRENIFLIILGYIFAVFAGVNGTQAIHDIFRTVTGVSHSGLVHRIISAVQVLLIYGIFRWSFTYICDREYTPDKDGHGVYEHPKYDSFTRVNGLIMLTVFFVAAIWYGSTLQW